ncbi:primase-helicase family protein [Agrobacterium pusense]|uniref:primase-helicase family protein n=1 Tax=Agrobacterium pusense TaxID=648995 RepID=UPI0005143025|nr:primase-helicase family protein [Agrobacterium pusense]ANV24122.1 hypothetical protein BA939_09335 [Rhizobium sp. S41]KGE84305.1 hypothetical protein LW14_03745 [Rhizobium sp. H41]QWW73764.1 hypothetical protein KP800_13865 [Agrobacterium pusense]
MRNNITLPTLLVNAVAFSNPDCLGAILSEAECKIYFKGCFLIKPSNRIIDSRGVIYTPEAFNSSYGGKLFVVTPDGKTTTVPWDAATKSLLWTIPKVDGVRFLPERPFGEITIDSLGREFVNTWVPPKIATLQINEEPDLFLRHLELLLPVRGDRVALIEYMAHAVKYPGYKIPWAPLIQSAEGVGKNVFKLIMRYAISSHYFYEPKAKQLNDSGAKFNGWMENKLFFICDEIKTDENRDMVETLKPFITETQLEIEGKGSNQRMGDTPGNWMFFSNHKNAIPIHKNGRRFAVFYSAIQSEADLNARSMDKAYFDTLYNWLGGDQNGNHKIGLMIVADWLLNYPIERGGVPTRAPVTSSREDALIESRGWLEVLIMDAVESQLNGFRGGYINTAAIGRIVAAERKSVQPATMGGALRNLGYVRIGQAGRGWHQDDPSNPNRRGWIWHTSTNASLTGYASAQSYAQ